MPSVFHSKLSGRTRAQARSVSEAEVVVARSTGRGRVSHSTSPSRERTASCSGCLRRRRCTRCHSSRGPSPRRPSCPLRRLGERHGPFESARRSGREGSLPLSRSNPHARPSEGGRRRTGLADEGGLGPDGARPDALLDDERVARVEAKRTGRLGRIMAVRLCVGREK